MPPNGPSVTPEVGQVWKRRGGKQRVRIARRWTICACDSPVMHHYMPEHNAGSVDAIRCLPTHGGSWWTVVPELLARYDLEADDAR